LPIQYRKLPGHQTDLTQNRISPKHIIIKTTTQRIEKEYSWM
jgi:hypothetical protein